MPVAPHECLLRPHLAIVVANTGGRSRDIKITPAEIKGRTLDLAIPPDGTEAQRTALQALIEYGKENGVIVKIVGMW
jgi:contact-dependent growth inhibition (CDI) system restriction endonuclease-like protein